MAFKMKGHLLPGPNQRKSPTKWKAPDEIFPGAKPTFVASIGWGGGKDGGGSFTKPGLSGDTWKYIGNEAYKYAAGGAKKFGKEIESFGKGLFEGGIKKFFG